MEVVLLGQPQCPPRQPLIVAVNGHTPQQCPEGSLAVHGTPGKVLRSQLRRATGLRISLQQHVRVTWLYYAALLQGRQGALILQPLAQQLREPAAVVRLYRTQRMKSSAFCKQPC